MTVDLAHDPLPDLPPGAVVVVGSGAAGLALTLELADRGEHVVLLESGGDPGAQNLAEDDRNRGGSTGLPYRGLVTGRGRVLGGSTELWHGQCVRLHPLDLEPRPWVPGSGWPLTLGQLGPHYEAAERWFGLSGRGYGAERWAERPRLTPLAWDPAHLTHAFTEYTPQVFSGRVHRERLEQHPRVTLVLNATAARVLTDGATTTGVEVRTHGADGALTVATIPADRVVLAAGALENARLLQLSDPAGVGLGAGREHTGRYLQDHPVIRTAEVLSTDHQVLQDRYVALHTGRGAGYRKLFPKVALADQAQREHELLAANAIFTHEHDDRAQQAVGRLLAAARARRRPADLRGDAQLGAGAVLPLARRIYRRYVRSLATGERPSAVWLDVWLEQAPEADRRVSLAAEVDSLGMRRASVHWTCSDAELATSRRLTRWVGEDLVRLGVGRLRELPTMTDDVAWRGSVADAYHPAGTTRMATTPEHGVVDPHLAVHGISGLFVLGSSVFPTSGYANPTLTVVALALRLADHLRRRS